MNCFVNFVNLVNFEGCWWIFVACNNISYIYTKKGCCLLSTTQLKHANMSITKWVRTQFQICHSIIVGEEARSETSLFIILVSFSLLRSSANYIACLSTSPSPLSSFMSMFQNVSHLDKYNIYMKVTENNGFYVKNASFLTLQTKYSTFWVSFDFLNQKFRN